MMLLIYALLVLAFYFFGAVPFMILIGRMRGVDLSHAPDLHHALWYEVGRPWGILGFSLDVLKGILPVALGFMLHLPLWVTALAALASLCGQMWPVFRKFDGERGNTVSLGINATLSIGNGAPLVLIIAVGFAGLGFIIRTILRWQSSGDTLNERLKFGGPPSLVLPLLVILGFISCPVTSWLFGQPVEITLCYAGAAVLMLVRRLTAGLLSDLRRIKRPAYVIVNRLLFDRSEI
jgi:acyl phosphate:glycerol-3-phosphate acyltransferase